MECLEVDYVLPIMAKQNYLTFGLGRLRALSKASKKIEAALDLTSFDEVRVPLGVVVELFLTE